jgi:endoglucanase
LARIETDGTAGCGHLRRWRAFAAVELYEATGEPVYHHVFVDAFRKNGGVLDGPIFGPNATGFATDAVMDYPNLFNFALMDYVRSRRATQPDVQSSIRAAFIHQADLLLKYCRASGYLAPMLYPGHLFWGSSGGVLAPSAMVLIRAFQWTGRQEYEDAAADGLHWILGRNPVDRVFVSGLGSYERGSDFYSQYWLDLRHQPPGALGGNVNVEGSAKTLVEHPWKRFFNSQDADMTEPGVYWNAAFAWLAGYFSIQAKND